MKKAILSVVFICNILFLSACNNGSCINDAVIPQTTHMTVDIISKSIITQSGGMATINVSLSNSLSSSEQIMLIAQNNQSDFIIQSNPSPCILTNNDESCRFNITTLDTAPLGKIDFKLVPSNPTLLLESTVSLFIIPPYKLYYANNGGHGYSANMLDQAITHEVAFVTNESGIFIFIPNPYEPTISIPSQQAMIYLPDNYTLEYGVAFMWTGLSSVWTMYPPISTTNNGLCSKVDGGVVMGYWNSNDSLSLGNVGTQLSNTPSIGATPTLNWTQIAAGSRGCNESARISVDSTYINGLICVEQ